MRKRRYLANAREADRCEADVKHPDHSVTRCFRLRKGNERYCTQHLKMLREGKPFLDSINGNQNQPLTPRAPAIEDE
jgi:hypothetical protein